MLPYLAKYILQNMLHILPKGLMRAGAGARERADSCIWERMREERIGYVDLRKREQGGRCPLCRSCTLLCWLSWCETMSERAFKISQVQMVLEHPSHSPSEGKEFSHNWFQKALLVSQLNQARSRWAQQIQ